MKLRTKLMIAPAITAGMLVLVLAGALWALESFKSKSGQQQTAMIEDHHKISTLQSELSEAHVDLYRTMAVVSSMGDKTVKAFREKRVGVLSKLAGLSQDQSMAASTDAKVKSALTLFATQINSYKKTSDLAIELSTEAPNADAMKKADEDYKTLDRTLTGLIASMQAQSTASTADLASGARRSAVLVGVFGVLAAIGSIVFAWMNQRRINSNISSAARAAQRVAAGRLDERPHSDDQDEIGELVRALGAMVEQLRSSITAVRDASESIHTASAEIATGNLDLSQRTEQAASNLQQAASSMDLLTGTVTQSANSAQEATRFAASAAEVAARGSIEVSNVVSTMQDINESSKKIGDIIGVIDGIAFQTNILALNAAVEAARAGEQGRGFAVVAGEVRSLAGRSAQAAREIKTLIRGSMDRVEAGSRLVTSAGHTMEEITLSVQRVSGIIREISTSASEQSNGISQINSSVLHLDQVTQQNAALVEQGAAAAENLKDQASLLATVVGRFQLKEAA